MIMKCFFVPIYIDMIRIITVIKFWCSCCCSFMSDSLFISTIIMNTSLIKNVLIIMCIVIFGIVNSVPNKIHVSCGSRLVTCKQGRDCIHDKEQCDGKIDCQDGSDEDAAYCTQYVCPENSVKCQDNVTCIAKDWQCDGGRECPDGSDEDEAFCLNFTCPEQYIKCADRLTCVLKTQVCDGNEDCLDGSDETPILCPIVYPVICADDQFLCKNGVRKCLPKSSLCDGISECDDGADEDVTFCRDFLHSVNYIKYLITMLNIE